MERQLRESDSIDAIVPSGEIHQWEERKHWDECHHGGDENAFRSKPIIDGCEQSGLVQSAEQAEYTKAQTNKRRRESKPTVSDVQGIKQRLERTQSNVEKRK